MFCFEIYCRESLSHFVLAYVMRRGWLRFNDQNSCTAARLYLGSLGTPSQLSRRVTGNFFLLVFSMPPATVLSPSLSKTSLTFRHTLQAFWCLHWCLVRLFFPRTQSGKCLTAGTPLPPTPLFLGWDFPQLGPPQAPWYRGASLHCWEPPSPGITAFLSLQALQCYWPLLSWCLISPFYLQAPNRAFHIYKNVYIIYPVRVI